VPHTAAVNPRFTSKPASRAIVVAFRCWPELARTIRQRAREDGRSPSAYLAFLLDRTLNGAGGEPHE
jgi:hypothetical protein